MMKDRRAVAALEFALTAPVFVATFFGLPELVRYIRTRTLAYMATPAIAEMVAAKAGVTSDRTGTMADYCEGALMTLSSYPGGSLTVPIASVTNSDTGVVRDWEYDAACPTASVGIGRSSAVTLGTAMVPNSRNSVIVVQSTFNYVPATVGIFAPITFIQTTYTRPRRTVVVCTVAGSSNTVCPAVP